MKKESLQAIRDAYIIERDCINEMMVYIDDEQFALIHPGGAVGKRLNNEAL